MIVDAALAVIAERGITGLTMSSVADRLGVRAPSLYHHVASKQTLLQLVTSHAFLRFEDDRAAYAAVSDLEEWLSLTAAGSRRLRRFYLAHPGLAALMQASALADRDQRPGPRGALITAQINALVRLGIPKRIARRTFLTCAHWTLAAVAADSSGGAPSSNDSTFDQGLGWLLHGVRARTAAALSQSSAERDTAARAATMSTFSNDGTCSNRSAFSCDALGPPADRSASLSSALANAANAPYVVGPRRKANHCVDSGCPSTTS